MKRKWHVGRVVAAVALSSFAAAIATAWPTAPRWRVAAEAVVGFDAQRHSLVTASDSLPAEADRRAAGAASVWLDWWDLDGGDHRHTLVLSGPARPCRVAWSDGGTAVALWGGAGPDIDLYS